MYSLSSRSSKVYGSKYKSFQLKNKNGVEVVINGLGAALSSYTMSDKAGLKRNILIDHHDYEGFLESGLRSGAVESSLVMLGSKVCFTKEEINRYLTNRVWEAKEILENKVTLKCQIHKFTKEYHIKLVYWVTYELNPSNLLSIDISLESNKVVQATVVHNTMYNLSGGLSDIRDTFVSIDADYYLRSDREGIAIDRVPVQGTVFDFTTPQQLKECLNLNDDDLFATKGFDHVFVVNGSGQRVVARIFEPSTGISLELHTDSSRLHFYTGNRKVKGSIGCGNYGSFTLKPKGNKTGSSSIMVDELASITPGSPYHIKTKFVAHTEMNKSANN
ncbi:hypothetical protein GT360_07965 [Vibrio astriarenae]|uniref:Aldose 1-epimerase n=1 Tax=Vibrio astriarenae TaxID=1481923 RepID=A0A7Z2T332_9VIBR|nr:hypothetical protein [Vibrio astriarenae]QIA63456.1 hypothetical protein GT360_07965 [Vibrio astriarenae]